MKKLSLLNGLAGTLILLPLAFPSTGFGANAVLLGWNDLGMHCMDSDYSVFAILPPYNVIHAQLIVGGRRLDLPSGYTVSYEAAPDPLGSINTTSVGKSEFWRYAEPLFGAPLALDLGLAGFAMPGPDNVPQLMQFDESLSWFTGEGIPLTPYDDAGLKNYYPLMRLTARNAADQVIATSDVVLPVSDEMDCRACHASGSNPVAQPAGGWVWSGDAERDYRLNILRLHDERHQSPALVQALASNGYNPAGLYRTVTADGRPVLCAGCHRSNALPGTGTGNIPPLTTALHRRHATVRDPLTGLTLDATANRSSCYRCHPGSETRCLRGVMGDSVAADGSRAIQCQSCHGSMSTVGNPAREGWFDEPNCQACHTGTATHNNGQIRYSSAREPAGQLRQAVDATFATQPDTPAPGVSLYRFSTGHGGLQCEACHGSTHAEYPSHDNDNLRIVQAQGHVGVLAECTACHSAMPNTVHGGPHGLHPLGQSWVHDHKDVAEHQGSAQCRVCHGTDYRGTVLSRALGDRVLSTEWGTKRFWRGAQIGCYACHRGPNDDDRNNNAPPVVAAATATTHSGQPVAIPLSASDANGNPLTLRIVSQSRHGTVALNQRTATYVSDPGFVGRDTFTFAAWDGSIESNLGTGTVNVAAGTFALTLQTRVPTQFPAGWSVPFTAYPRRSNTTASVTYDWQFGDGTAPGSRQFEAHAYAAPGTYSWTLTATVKQGATSATATDQGVIVVTAPMRLQVNSAPDQVEVSWPRANADVLLEQTDSLLPGSSWQWVTNQPTLHPSHVSVPLQPDTESKFYRLRRAQ